MDKHKRGKQGVTVKALPIGPHGATVLSIDPTETADYVLEKARQQGMTLGAKAHKLNRMANIINEQVLDKLKRGKDIKVFADLPPDVQQTIDSLSMVDGKICQRVKANRTAIAINYQHLFPDSYGLGAIELMRAEADYPGDDHSTGVV